MLQPAAGNVNDEARRPVEQNREPEADKHEKDSKNPQRKKNTKTIKDSSDLVHHSTFAVNIAKSFIHE